MKKYLLVTLLLTMLLTSSAQAAPLDDYSKAGNWGVSIFTQRTDMDDTITSTTNTASGKRFFDYDDAKWSWGGEVTVSVMPRFALSFDYLGSKSKDTVLFTAPSGYFASNSSKLNSYNIKLKYQVYKDEKLFIAPYLGVALNKLQQKYTPNYPAMGYFTHSYDSKRKTSVLAGVTAVYSLDKDNRFKTYFDGAVGNKVYSWNLGLAYGVSKNLDLDFGYRYYRAKDMSYAHPDTPYVTSSGWPTYMAAVYGTMDSKSKGLYFGLSYRFN